MVDKSKIVVILHQMSELLEAAEHDGQAAYTREAASLATGDWEPFKSALLAVDMWGGSGAVWEVAPFPSRGEEKRFTRLVVDLADEMAALRIRDPRVEEISGVLRYWLDVDIWAQIDSSGPAQIIERKVPGDHIKNYLARRHRHGKGPNGPGKRG